MGSASRPQYGLSCSGLKTCSSEYLSVLNMSLQVSTVGIGTLGSHCHATKGLQSKVVSFVRDKCLICKIVPLMSYLTGLAF